jgi:hypothetical protein
MINEFLPNEPGSDSASKVSFVELRGQPGLQLTGAKLEFVNGPDGTVYDSVALVGAVPADGLLVVGEALVEDVDQEHAINIQNGPDLVRVVDASGGTLDAVAYGELSAWAVTGEGEPALLPDEGQTLARAPLSQFSNADSDQNRSDFCATPATPGAHNAVCSGGAGNGGSAGTAGVASGGSAGCHDSGH